ncbi:MAG: type II secretion system F family protein, partial [Catenulispora sp.]
AGSPVDVPDHHGRGELSMTAALVLAAVAMALAGRRLRVVRQRSLRAHAPRLGGRHTIRVAAAGLGLALAFVLGGVVGAAVGVGAAVAADRVVPRLEPASARRHRQDRAAELPLVLDLLSVCLRAGMPLVAAQETVAEALPGPFTEDLRIVAGMQRLGAAPAAAWAELASDPDLAPVVRTVARSAESGSRLAAAFDRLAADRRGALVAAGMSRARTAGVVAMAPLGLCFLPAFVCLGITPIVLSLAGEVLRT